MKVGELNEVTGDSRKTPRWDLNICASVKASLRNGSMAVSEMKKMVEGCGGAKQGGVVRQRIAKYGRKARCWSLLQLGGAGSDQPWTQTKW